MAGGLGLRWTLEKGRLLGRSLAGTCYEVKLVRVDGPAVKVTAEHRHEIVDALNAAGMLGLNATVRAVFWVIWEHLRQHGISPSTRRIATAVGKNNAVAGAAVRQLLREGHLEEARTGDGEPPARREVGTLRIPQQRRHRDTGSASLNAITVVMFALVLSGFLGTRTPTGTGVAMVLITLLGLLVIRRWQIRTRRVVSG